jgi:hypothetical protein
MTTKSEQRERSPRTFWFDPRFVIGIVLVVASVAGVLLVVSTADKTTTVYAARATLSVGDHIERADLAEHSVRLGAATARYLTADAVPAEGLIVTRTIAEGELVPMAAVGNSAGERLSSIVITVGSKLPVAVGAGAVVDVWASREGDSGAFGPPTVLIPSATVVRVEESEGLIAGAGAVSVELLVPRSRTARLLEALANADALSLVPVNLPLSASGRS